MLTVLTCSHREDIETRLRSGPPFQHKPPLVLKVAVTWAIAPCSCSSSAISLVCWQMTSQTYWTTLIRLRGVHPRFWNLMCPPPPPQDARITLILTDQVQVVSHAWAQHIHVSLQGSSHGEEAEEGQWWTCSFNTVVYPITLAFLSLSLHCWSITTHPTATTCVSLCICLCTTFTSIGPFTSCSIRLASLIWWTCDLWTSFLLFHS